MPGVSNHFDTLVAIKGIIDGMDLNGLTGGTAIQEVAEYLDGQTVTPFISLSPYAAETVSDELNDRDGIHYAILVCLIGKRDIASLEQRLGWRQAIRRRLNNSAINQLGQNYLLKVEPGNVVEPRAFFDRKAFVSGFVVRASFQEPRT